MTSNPGPELTYVIIIGTVTTFLIAAALILFVISYQKRNLANKLKLQKLETQHQKELIESSFQGQEKERKRIARDLHDDIGSLLSATKLQISLLKMKLKNNPELALIADESIDTISKTIGEVRSISRNLSPYLLNSLGFSKAIEFLVQKVDHASEFKASFSENGQPAQLDEKKQINLYRAVQELVNNSIRHSKASKLEVMLEWNDGSLEILIRDNGCGFDTNLMNQQEQRGLGLTNIKTRLGIAGAAMDIRSSGNGTTAIIRTRVN
ncbi:MAG TPA: histidine kinase [Cyclobacteriaceae bacterium]|nr:histidine kinase [Cyclobacteriaceae bacterium]